MESIWVSLSFIGFYSDHWFDISIRTDGTIRSVIKVLIKDEDLLKSWKVFLSIEYHELIALLYNTTDPLFWDLQKR